MKTNFLWEEFNNLEEKNKIQYIYQTIFHMRIAKQYEEIDKILSQCDNLSCVLYLCFLSITACIKEYLPSRKLLWQKACSTCSSASLVGLE